MEILLIILKVLCIFIVLIMAGICVVLGVLTIILKKKLPQIESSIKNMRTQVQTVSTSGKGIQSSVLAWLHSLFSDPGFISNALLILFSLPQFRALGIVRTISAHPIARTILTALRLPK